MDQGTDAEADELVVLIVDDDEPTRQLFAAALARAGFATRAAAEGRDVLDIVSDEPVGVVLLDDRMPGMSGLEVLAELRSSPGGATLPVIFVTGQDELDDRIRGLEAGANDYLTKPVELVELVARVRAQLRAKAASTTTVDDLERRLDAVMLLRRIARAETAELTAREVCAELTRLEGIDGAAVMVVRGGRAVVPLAVYGALEVELVPGAPLGEAVAPQLARRLRHGPWIEHSESDMGPRNSGVFSLATIERLAVAPLEGRDGPLGALLLAGDGSASAAPSVLSAAIDFATVVSTLIAPDLERQEALDESRSALRRVVSTGAFVPHYQPVVDLTSDVLVGYEALTRWSDGTRPDVRFAEAKALGIGVEVERATLQALVRDARGFDTTLWLSLNVSADLILSGSLDDLVAKQNQPIVLELTEHEPVEDYPRLQHAVRAIPDVRLSVDDAGAGYASMRHILDLRPDFVKLDISWVRDLNTDSARQALTAGMVGFAAELGCTLIAEGIETEAERAALEHLGVTLGQGYLLGRPAPAGQPTV
jgi:EAL domain-containing protein (putative c-di-GMP-specific phosphodiesterase class I)/DNA-binding response OmpR family regulator